MKAVLKEIHKMEHHCIKCEELLEDCKNVKERELKQAIAWFFVAKDALSKAEVILKQAEENAT